VHEEVVHATISIFNFYNVFCLLWVAMRTWITTSNLEWCHHQQRQRQ